MQLIISLFLTLLLVFYALIKDALTLEGLITAGIITFLVTYFAGYPFFLMIVLVFMLDRIFAKITKKKSDKKRTIWQMLANLSLAGVASILYYFFSKDYLLIIIASVLAGSLADTLASTIGSVSSKCIDIARFKKINPGVSGAVSILGILASLMGSLVISNTYYYLVNSNLKVFYFITIIGFLGSIIDSIIGSLFQVRYYCSKCQKYGDSNSCCGKKTKKVSGFIFVNNNLVNFLESLVIFIVTFLCFK